MLLEPLEAADFEDLLSHLSTIFVKISKKCFKEITRFFPEARSVLVQCLAPFYIYIL